jgi:hypothetical protein
VGRAGQPRDEGASIRGRPDTRDPLADFDVAPRLLRIPESEAPVIQLPLLGRYLHAPTAAIIYQFCQVAMHGHTVRVSHFEQPVFAWK